MHSNRIGRWGPRGMARLRMNNAMCDVRMGVKSCEALEGPGKHPTQHPSGMQAKETVYGLPDIWGSPPAAPRLAPNEVHIWVADLDLPPSQIQALGHALSEDEQRRAARYQFPEHRRQFIAARGRLRQILARYLGAQPGELQYAHNRFGKPSLTGGPAESDLRFNLSHSGGMAALAIARGVDLGVDLELVWGREAPIEIAPRFFSPTEVAALASLDPENRERGFFTCWVRKEAYIKARGEGLSCPLDAFSVSLSPDRPPRLLANSLDPREPSRWLLRELPLGEGFSGAVAIPRGDWRFRYWRWRRREGDGRRLRRSGECAVPG